MWKKGLSIETIYLLLFYFYWGRRFARSQKGVTRDYYYSDYSFSVWQPWSFLAVAPIFACPQTGFHGAALVQNLATPLGRRGSGGTPSGKLGPQNRWKRNENQRFWLLGEAKVVVWFRSKNNYDYFYFIFLRWLTVFLVVAHTVNYYYCFSVYFASDTWLFAK